MVRPWKNEDSKRQRKMEKYYELQDELFGTEEGRQKEEEGCGKWMLFGILFIIASLISSCCNQ